MADTVDQDTLEAVQSLWLTSQELPTLLDRSPAAGMARSPREQPLTLPYGVIKCEGVPGKTVRYVKAIRKDVRKVTLEVYGTHDQTQAALTAMLALFNSQLGAPNRPTLVFPSGVKFIKWWPTNDGSHAKDKDTRGGEDVWKASVEGEVYSTRSEV